ncbi:MAG TPA: Gfo/Idh/MocA family oxidoreductase [Candidatus Corynebacterium avicola]|uniref:Gfo/Idh/MocA family oxidoreductase n=1 Tax=Candidatus Corynebacterium avicola TaxID=2838527 RepID=A0A9D1UK47_9CORY|nr:Gfo/Idh/MocA family oxidoreductase [Candidatus Corynebacterium avicola]
MTSPAPIRAAILGFGLSGRYFHAPFLAADPSFDVTAVVTSNPERQDAARELFPDVRLLDSVEEVWSAEDVDLVVIGTPSSAHEAHAEAALDAGKHVVVDKPFAVTSETGRALIEKAQSKGLMLTVFQNRRWDGDFLTLRKLLDSGELGEIRRFESRFEKWRPQADQSWKTDSTHEQGGGILFDLGSHLIDQALQLFGPVADVYSEVETRREFVQAEDDVFLALRHESGVLSHLWMSAVAPGPAPRFRLLGSQGGYECPGIDGQEAALRGGASPTEEGFGTTPEAEWGQIYTGEKGQAYPTEDGDYADYYRKVAQAIRGEGDAPVDPADSVAALEIIERAMQ